MKRRDMLAAMALTAPVIAASAQTASAQSAPAIVSGPSNLDRILQAGVIRSGVLAGQEPYWHKDLVSGEWSGSCVEMAKSIAEALDVKLELVETTWGNSILDLQSGKIDMGFALNPTPARALAIDFSSPLLVHSFTIVTRPGFSRATWAELNNPDVKIAVDIGTTHEIIARRYAPNAEILAFKVRDEAVLAVATGRADCAVTMAVLAISTLAKNPQLGDLVIPAPLLTLPTNIGVRKDSDKQFRDFLSIWADYNRSMGQTREWMLNGFASLDIKLEDIPPQIQF